MTAPVTAGALGAEAAAPQGPPEDVRHAAMQFEALLLRQLVSAMTSSVGQGGLFGAGAGAQIYTHLFETNLANALAEGGGIGLRAIVERQLAPQAYRSQAGPTEGGIALPERPPSPTSPFRPRTVGPVLEARPTSGAALPGETATLQSAAAVMLGPTGHAPQWGRAGRLTEADLASDFATDGPNGPAFFNVRDANGFEDCYKCNLFAFELVRRAGFQVPLIGRPRGWGYMGPDGVTADANRGRLRAGWGRVVTGESAESLDSSIVRGERAFMLTGNSVGDHAGHMGVIERVHEIDYDENGEIRRIVFDGWEGRSTGARHLVRRTWNRYGNPGGNDPRGGFESIHIIELERPAPGDGEEVPTHARARPSVRDTFSSRPTARRPMTRAEESP